jgi:hypothetical protein
MGEFFTGIFAFLGAFFVFGTLWFWVVGAAFFGLMIYWTEDDSNFLASLLLAAFIWTTASVNGFSIVANPVLWLKLAALYFAVGTVWSFLKWFSYLHRVKDELRKHKENYVHKTKVELQDNGQFYDNDFAGFAAYLNDMRYFGYGSSHTIETRADVVPTMADNFRKLVRWIAWWPFSAFWTILNDPIRRLVEFIVRRLRTAYDGLANRVFKNEV